ncbi:uncharacterized protein [Amphiura filiformis]|uniref:uncharacterized protein n=1 Tax=Amphiura filiformis TaxID=82378 RepID=UPI003B217A2F
MLFVSYPSLCDVILSLLPMTCQKFCVDENNLYCTHLVRSDYSIECDTRKHKNYINSAYVALVYVVGFPLVVLCVILKNSPPNLKAIQGNQEREDDNDSNCTESTFLEDDDEYNNNNRRENHLDEIDNTAVENESTENMASEQTVLEDSDNTQVTLEAIQGNQELEAGNDSNCTASEDDDKDATNNKSEPNLGEIGNADEDNEEIEDVASAETPTVLEECDNTQKNNDTLQYPLYIRFLCENYETKYWYWEIVELFRKVVQPSLIVLFGSGDPLTLGATIALSMVLITSHAYFKPMKDSFENMLQMTSLVAIFLNMLCAEVLLVPLTDPSGNRQTAMAVFIIALNVSVVLLAIGNSIMILWRSVKQHGCSGACSCQNCLSIANRILSSVSNGSRHRPASNGHNPAPV